MNNNPKKKLTATEMAAIKQNKTKKGDEGIYNRFSEMINTLKGYHYIPVIGMIIYSGKISMAGLEVPPFYKRTIARYYTINSLVTMAVALPIFIVGLAIDWKYKPGGMPVIFGVDMALFLPLSIQPFGTRHLYVIGLERYEKLAQRH